MSRRSVNVERLELRLRGVSPQAARDAAHGLARELVEELARGGDALRGGGRGRVRVERVEATVPVADAVSPSGAGTLARRVADAVRVRIK